MTVGGALQVKLYAPSCVTDRTLVLDVSVHRVAVGLSVDSEDTTLPSCTHTDAP